MSARYSLAFSTERSNMAKNDIKKLTGRMFTGMLWYGINSLEYHRKRINELNVFPVPDGDTGTNMLLTLQHAFGAVNQKEDDLDEVIEDFAHRGVYGARGNSGVIISQFFRGMAEEIKGDDANVRELAGALVEGYRFAYRAVEKPVEGTILTVMREAAYAVESAARKLNTVNEAIDLFIKVGRESLERTPDLLPVLKKRALSTRAEQVLCTSLRVCAAISTPSRSTPSRMAHIRRPSQPPTIQPLTVRASLSTATAPKRCSN